MIYGVGCGLFITLVSSKHLRDRTFGDNEAMVADGPRTMQRTQEVKTFNRESLQNIINVDTYPELRSFVLRSFMKRILSDDWQKNYTTGTESKENEALSNSLAMDLLAKGTQSDHEECMKYLRSRSGQSLP